MSQSATAETALKSLLETGAFGIPFFRRTAPQYKGDGSPQTLPYGVIHPLGRTPSRYGDGRATTKIEQVQVDVYQYLHDPQAHERLEDLTLTKRIERFLDGAKLPTAPEYVWRCRVRDSRPVVYDDLAMDGLGLSQDSITLEITSAVAALEP